MLFWVFYKAHDLLERLVYKSLTTLIYLSFFIAIAHVFGWLERWIWWTLEREASKILNGSNITLGSFTLDWSKILHGKITLHASNVVLHTPQREQWQWESPLVGRVGKASVECNAPITVFHLVFFRQLLPIEAYSIEVFDVQVFVERHESVFNVYLLDPSLDLTPPPPPPTATTEITITTTTTTTGDSSAPTSPTKSKITDNSALLKGEDGDGQHKEQAQQLVNDMLQAVQSLQKAAHKGSLQSAMKQQGLEFADRLRGFGKKENLDDGMRVMQHVGKVAVRSLQSTKVVLPERKSRRVPKPVYARIGRVVLKDVRIFTKDSWIPTEDNATGGWNKPIFIESLLVRASELCPPMSLKDENNLPAIYQTIDKSVEVVWRRLLAEMAKSNTGRLFQTAVGEVLSIIKNNPTPSTKSKTMKSDPTPKSNFKFKPKTDSKTKSFSRAEVTRQEVRV